MNTELPISTPTTLQNNGRPWLILFGAIQVLISVSLAILLAILLFAFFRLGARLPPMRPGASLGTVVMFVAATYGGLAIVFLLLGLGSILRRNWARIGTLIVSGLWLGTGSFTMVFMLLVYPSIAQRRAFLVRPHLHSLAFMAGFSGIFMVALPAVFLFVYSRKSVRETCGRTATTSCVPIPIIVLSVWQGLHALQITGFFYTRGTIVFGVRVHGITAFLILFAFSVLSGYSAWCIYRLKFVG